MASFRLIVQSNAVPGREQEYNDWYQNTHLAEITAIPGFVSAQRFRLKASLAGEAAPYLAIYEINADDPMAVLEEMRIRAESGRMTMSDSLSLDISCLCYETLGERVTS